jgi:hypothetical protein
MQTSDSWLRPVSEQQQEETVLVNDDTLLGSTLGKLKKIMQLVDSTPVQQQQQQQQQPIEGGNIDALSMLITSLNSNPYMIASLMLLLNLGGRFLSTELSPKQEEFLQQRWLRPLLFFTVIFIATRNLAVAFWMTLLLFLVLWVLANEQSPFCLIPSWRSFDTPIEQQVHTYESNMDAIEHLHHLSHPAE